jgi:phage-related minor tail protein
MKEQYVKLAKEAGLTGDALLQLETSFDNLGSDNNADSLETIGGTFNMLGTASQAVEGDIRATADAMNETMVAAGMSEEKMQTLKEACEA